MKKLDMRTMVCPVPMIKTKQALDEKGVSKVEVIVDNDIALQNIKKMSEEENYEMSFEKKSDKEYHIFIEKKDDKVKNEVKADKEKTDDESSKYTVLFGKNTMGDGEKDLGEILIKGFIFSLSQSQDIPKSLVFLNSAAFLTSKEYNTVEDLKILEEKGVKIMTCGTCINFYNLDKEPAVGEVVDMYEITKTLIESKKVISV